MKNGSFICKTVVNFYMDDIFLKAQKNFTFAEKHSVPKLDLIKFQIYINILLFLKKVNAMLNGKYSVSASSVFVGSLARPSWDPGGLSLSCILVKTVTGGKYWPLVFPSFPLSHPYIVSAASPLIFSLKQGKGKDKDDFERITLLSMDLNRTLNTKHPVFSFN